MMEGLKLFSVMFVWLFVGLLSGYLVGIDTDTEDQQLKPCVSVKRELQACPPAPECPACSAAAEPAPPPVCPEEQPHISPALVLELARACRAGTLEFPSPNVTLKP